MLFLLFVASSLILPCMIEHKVHSMPSPIYQNMVNLIVDFPIWRHPSIFMDVAMWEHSTFD
jgi:hypothetical protein